MTDAYKKTARGKNPVAIGAVLAIIVFILVAPILADGDAMSPTIKDGDWIIIQKKGFSENQGYPEYGELVAFKKDYYEGEEKGEYVFGRVIGLPGDEIIIEKGKIYRNGDAIDESDEDYNIKGNTTGEAQVSLKDEEVFILGDNRGKAVDSRDPEVGALKMETIRGKVLIRLWPLNRIGIVD